MVDAVQKSGGDLNLSSDNSAKKIASGHSKQMIEDRIKFMDGFLVGFCRNN